MKAATAAPQLLPKCAAYARETNQRLSTNSAIKLVLG